MIHRKTIELGGIIQGIGLRPSIYRLADEIGVGGYVQNCSGKVVLVIEGSPSQLTEFEDRLPGALPEQARIDRWQVVDEQVLPDCTRTRFRIAVSMGSELSDVMIPMDLAM